jgi:hypothetical protein
LTRRVRRYIAGLTIAAVIGGCQSPRAVDQGSVETLMPPATIQSAEPAVLGLDWAKATSVEGPRNFEETLPPSFHQDHPILRFPGQAILSDVAGLAGTGAVAVGFIPPDWTPAAWSSTDGLTWQLHLLGDATFTFPVALVVGGNGRTVAVGRSRKVPVAWTTDDGTAWQLHNVPVLGNAGEFERMTSVAYASGRFVAGGSVGPEVGDRHARFWNSGDGIAWQPADDDPDAFDNAEVRAIAAVPEGFVAVGVVGRTDQPTGSVAWTSSDGRHWARHDSPGFVSGSAVSVTAAPFGGVVAVGSTVDRREAIAWTSANGKDWTRSPSEPSRKYYEGYISMTDVVAVDEMVVAAGDYQSLQRATGTAWISTDGMTWERAGEIPVLEQADLHAIALGGPGLILVGDFGGPDSHVPTIWYSRAAPSH